jgi:flagellar motor switch protein FliM
VERILSREEIAELLSAVHGGDLPAKTEEPPPSPAGERRITRLDLVSQQGPRHYKIENLDLTLDAFARNFGISLTNRLQRSVAVRRDGIEVHDFDSYLEQLSGREALAVIRLDPLRWRGLIILSENLSFYIIEHLLGGVRDSGPILPGRPLTVIETNLLRGAITDACLDLDKAFHPLENLECSVVKIESSPRLVNIVPADAAVLALRFSVSGEFRTDGLTLLIPQAAMEPLKEKMRARNAAFPETQDRPWQLHLEQEIKQMDIGLSARLTTLNLTVRDILNFQEGDVLDLGCTVNAPLQVLAEGQKKFLAAAGAHQGKKAVRIIGRTGLNGPT